MIVNSLRYFRLFSHLQACVIKVVQFTYSSGLCYKSENQLVEFHFYMEVSGQNSTECRLCGETTKKKVKKNYFFSDSEIVWNVLPPNKNLKNLPRLARVHRKNFNANWKQVNTKTSRIGDLSFKKSST